MGNAGIFARITTEYQIESLICQSNDSGTWVNDLKECHNRDWSGELEDIIIKVWNDSTSMYEETFKDVYSYDGDGNLIEILFQDKVGANWVDTYRITYTNGTNGKPTSSLAESWDGTNWNNSSKTTYTYDANNNVTSATSQNWDGAMWVNSTKFNYTYDANNLNTEIISQYWDSGSSMWVDSYRNTYTYNASDKIVTSVGESYDGTNWNPSYEQTYVYDGNGNLSTCKGAFWAGSAYEDDVLYTYTWGALSSVPEPIVSFQPSVYPNPFNTTATISFNYLNAASYSFELFTISGISVLKYDEVKEGRIEISRDIIEPGMYIYSITGEDGVVSTGKLVAQ